MKKKKMEYKGKFKKKKMKTPHTNKKTHTKPQSTKNKPKQKSPNKPQQTNNIPELSADKEVLNSRRKKFGWKNTWTKRHIENSFDTSP